MGGGWLSSSSSSSSGGRHAQRLQGLKITLKDIEIDHAANAGHIGFV